MVQGLRSLPGAHIMSQMTFEQIFDLSFERANASPVNGRHFFEAFYQRFLATSPGVAEKFRHTDMAHQQKMLRRSFYSLVSFYASYQADHCLEDIAIKHDKKHLDIHPELYDLWLDNLIETAREFDPRFDDDVELVWRLVMSPGIVYMKFHYDK